jgi:hypothetical protein
VSNGIIVKIVTGLGMGLVCIDLRTGSKGRSTLQDDGTADSERILSCAYPQEAFDNDQEVPLDDVRLVWLCFDVLENWLFG